MACDIWGRTANISWTLLLPEALLAELNPGAAPLPLRRLYREHTNDPRTSDSWVLE